MEARSPLESLRTGGFASTHWTTIRACANNDAAAVAARQTLCRDYWYPVYAYIKRVGRQGCEAEDLTQDFFADILNRPWFSRADQSKGKFRSFLLASLDNFLRDRHSRKMAIKRGGASQHIPLDIGETASRFSRSLPASAEPSEIYEVEWAFAIVQASLKRLADEYSAAGKQRHFDHLKGYLQADDGTNTHESTATALGISVPNVKVSVHRLRKRYGAILREEVARTVAASEDVEEEMRHMRAVLAAG